MKPAVVLEGITQVYVTDRGASLAIDNISFSVDPGEFISLVGPSGCGKTTVLSTIAGLIHPTRGEVKLFGEKVESPSEKVGYMLQQDYLFPWRTIWQNLMIGLELTGRLNDPHKKYARHLLEEIGLAGTEQLYPSQLSGGMRQRVALARTLATEPEVLLLDEPFSALDYQTKLQLEDLLSHTLSIRGKTALLVTHDISEAVAMSDRVLIMGRNPGTIRKEVIIPEEIREATPLKAREHPQFHPLFHQIWRELETEERKEGKPDGA